MTSQFQLYINGQFEDGAAQFNSINPATGQVWAKMPEARTDEVNRAVAAASQALQDAAWAGLTASQRGKLLYKLADLIEKAAPQLAQYETSDTGKIIRETSSQIAYVAEYYRYYAGIADKLEGSYLPIDKPDMQAWTIREPVGVIAAIVPWNSQLFLSAVKVGPALAAGCSIVLKASEEGPAPLLAFARLVHEAGFPGGVVNIITGFGPECGAVLSSHPDVAHVAFTGGPETARHIVRNSAENLAKVSLELGGKSPFIVFSDADLQSAVNAQVAAILQQQGKVVLLVHGCWLKTVSKMNLFNVWLSVFKVSRLVCLMIWQLNMALCAPYANVKKLSKSLLARFSKGRNYWQVGKRLKEQVITIHLQF